MDTDRILHCIFEEARKMPGKDLREKLASLMLEIVAQVDQAIEDLTRVTKEKEYSEQLKRLR